MKKCIVFFLLLITLSHANGYVKVDVNAICSDSTNIVSKFSITISSNKLNLTQDAIQDNLGGYVDIPEDRYYLKTDKGVHRLNGVVEYNYESQINQFTSNMTIEEFEALKNSENVKFIQKINLQKNNNRTTTNTLNLYFDKKYQKCKEQVKL